MPQDTINDVVKRPHTMDDFVFQEMARDVYRALQYVGPGDVVLDIGANVGAFACHVLKHVPGVKLICVEPIPSNCQVLRRNVGDRAAVEALAVSGTSGTLTMFDFGDAASACHSIYDVGADGALPIQVATQTLQGLMAKYELQRVRFLKMDCQGAEFEIIPSTPHDVLARIDCIAMEIHPSIWGLEGRIGNIPEATSKMTRLYRHLITTHLPSYGRLYHGDVELWLNRRDIPHETQAKLLRKYRFVSLYRPVLYPVLRRLKRSVEGMRRRVVASKKRK